MIKRSPKLWVSIVLIGMVLAGLLYVLLLGTQEKELARVQSPDGHCVAILFHKEKHGLFLPGPEPPRTLKRWAQLKVVVNGKTVYDSGYENLNIYQYSAGFALDLMWSPNSTRLAYRHITSLRVVGRDGKSTAQTIMPEDSIISSFRWIDDANLLVVSKTTQYPLDLSKRPYLFGGYADNAKNIRIARWNIEKGAAERYQQDLGNPTFLFHAVDFHVDEISPNADRVAFSDGSNLCIYDDATDKVIVKVRIPQKPPPKSHLPSDYPPEIAKSVKELASEPAQLEGVWWQTNDRLVFGAGLMGFPAKSFYTYDIPSNSLADVTSVLLPIWEGNETAMKMNYQDTDWYRTAIK